MNLDLSFLSSSLMQLRISIPYYLFFFRLCSLFHKDCDINSAYEQYAVL